MKGEELHNVDTFIYQVESGHIRRLLRDDSAR